MEKKENKDFKFIKNFNKITMTALCKELGLSRSYVMSGMASDEVYALLKKNILIKVENAQINND